MVWAQAVDVSNSFIRNRQGAESTRRVRALLDMSDREAAVVDDGRPRRRKRRQPRAEAKRDTEDVAPVASGSSQPPASEPPLLTSDADDYEQLNPYVMTRLNSPMALSGDVLRRTFDTRLSSFSERAAQARRDSPMRSSV